MTALRPGQSPPPVSTPILAMARILSPPSSPHVGYAQRLVDRLGPSPVAALGVVDAELAHARQRVGVGDKLGQRGRPEAARDRDDGFHREPVGRVVAQSAYELAVDLEQ